MTKKHFNAFATALKAAQPNVFQTARYEQWRDDVIAVLEVCAKSNPNFDKGRFLAACGIPNIIME